MYEPMQQLTSRPLLYRQKIVIFRISEVRVEQRDLENIVVNHIFQFFAKKKSRFQVSRRDIYSENIHIYNDLF